MPQIDLKNATLKIKDGGANEIEVKIGEGNLTYSEKRNMDYTLDRGILDLVREGDQEPLDVSFDFTWEWLRALSGGTETVEEALKKIGEASAWVTTGADACAPYSVDLEFSIDANCGTVWGEIITFSEFRWEELSHDSRAGTVSVSGKCNEVSPTIIRSSI